MENNQSPVLQRRELPAIVNLSLEPHERTLLKELDLTQTNAKVELTDEMNSEWLRALNQFPGEAIEAAFRGWRDVSPFFPAISDIRELCMVWARRQAEAREYAEQAQRRSEIEAARERGELIEWPEVLKKFSEICARGTTEKLAAKRFPEVPKDAEIFISPERRAIIQQQIEKAKTLYGK